MSKHISASLYRPGLAALGGLLVAYAVVACTTGGAASSSPTPQNGESSPHREEGNSVVASSYADASCQSVCPVGMAAWMKDPSLRFVSECITVDGQPTGVRQCHEACTEVSVCPSEECTKQGGSRVKLCLCAGPNPPGPAYPNPNIQCVPEPPRPPIYWGDGYYLEQNNPRVYLLYAESKWCWVKSEEQLDAYGATHDVVVLGPNRDLGSQRTYTGECGWPDGFYKEEDEPAVFRLFGGDSWCRVRDEVQLDLFGGASIIRHVALQSDMGRGRKWAGMCSDP